MATKVLRPVGHEEHLSLVEHLDELRTRLIICLVAFVAAFAVSLWQDDALLDIVNKPLRETTQEAQGGGRISEVARAQAKQREYVDAVNAALAALSADAELEPATRDALREAVAKGTALADELPKAVPKREPVTLGVGEPFTTTLMVAAWFGLLFSLPLILYQLYGFILPAFTPEEKRVALPLLLMVPFLFVAGVAFGYFVVLPPAISFLQNFNAGSFDILVQARDYYRFAVMALIAMGLLFQIPVGILAITRLGIVSVAQLRKNRRYAIVVMAVIAMLLPGTDPVTMLIAMAPLVVLFELSILLAAFFDRRRARAEAAATDLVPPGDV